MTLHAPTRILSSPPPPVSALTWARAGSSARSNRARRMRSRMTGSRALYCLRARAGQFDLVCGHPLSALGKLSVNVGKPVGAPVVGIPLSQCLLAGCEVGRVFECLDGSRPRGGYAGGDDRGNPAALRVGQVDHLPALGSVMDRAGQSGSVIDRHLGHVIRVRPGGDGRPGEDPQPAHSTGGSRGRLHSKRQQPSYPNCDVGHISLVWRSRAVGGGRLRTPVDTAPTVLACGWCLRWAGTGYSLDG